MKILILYSIPHGTLKYSDWSDGFTHAIDILKKDKYMTIDMINFTDTKPNLNDYDIAIIKWGFGSHMQKYAIDYFAKNERKCKLGIFVSSVKYPTQSELDLYDLIFYETEWYKNVSGIKKHSNIYHAFGVNTDIMKPVRAQKKYDYIFVGNITEYKRPLLLLNKKGTKLAIGSHENKLLVSALTKNNVEVRDYANYSALAHLYNSSKTCYVPCRIDGGGERAVLEARACGINVEIESDNAKLNELLESPIYDSYYYADQIRRGLHYTINNTITCPIDLYKLYSTSRVTVVQIGAMDGKTFDHLHPYILNNANVTAYLFEPVRYYFNELVQTYQHADGHIVLLNNAVAQTNATTPFYMIDPDKIVNLELPQFLKGISSLYPDKNSLGESYWNNRGKVLTSKHGWTYDTLIKPNIITTSVKSINVSTFLSKYNINHIDILIISAEGSELNILKYFIADIKPRYIVFKSNNLSQSEIQQSNDLLLSNNYRYKYTNNSECIAFYLY